MFDEKCTQKCKVWGIDYTEVYKHYVRLIYDDRGVNVLLKPWTFEYELVSNKIIQAASFSYYNIKISGYKYVLRLRFVQFIKIVCVYYNKIVIFSVLL